MRIHEVFWSILGACLAGLFEGCFGYEYVRVAYLHWLCYFYVLCTTQYHHVYTSSFLLTRSYTDSWRIRAKPTGLRCNENYPPDMASKSISARSRVLIPSFVCARTTVQLTPPPQPPKPKPPPDSSRTHQQTPISTPQPSSYPSKSASSHRSKSLRT